LNRIAYIVVAIPILIPGLASPDTQERYRVKVTASSTKGTSVRSVTAEAHYTQKPEDVWTLLNAIDDFPTYIPRLRSLESLGTSSGKERVYFLVNTPWPIANIWNIVTLTRDAASKRFSWEMSQGNIRKNTGSFVVEGEGEGSVVRLNLSADLGLLVPNWMLDWGIKKFFPKIFVAVGQRLEKGPGPKVTPTEVATPLASTK
jgi:uncharacterized membrane protein